MKTPIQKLLAMLRSRGVLGAVGPKGPGSSESEGYSLHASTGETVFGDRPLRMRNMTLAEPVFDDPSNLPGGFKIRLSKHRPGRLEAGSLVRNRYGDRGYRLPRLHQERTVHTFIAYDEGRLVGTVAVRLDSRKGLAADELYGAEVSALRQQGARLCEFTRLAVDRSAASKPVLAGLFHTAYLYASLLRGCTHAVIEVTPQHSAFYKRALNFERLGNERLNPRVNTKGVLMSVSFAVIAEALARYAGQEQAPGASRSLFVYGFPPDEEVGVLARLRELDEQP